MNGIPRISFGQGNQQVVAQRKQTIAATTGESKNKNQDVSDSKPVVVSETKTANGYVIQVMKGGDSGQHR